MPFCTSPNVRITRLSGRLDASSPGARELVVKLEIFEVMEIERRRLLEIITLTRWPELGAQQPLTRVQSALSRRDASDRARLRAATSSVTRSRVEPTRHAWLRRRHRRSTRPHTRRRAGKAPAMTVSSAMAIVSRRLVLQTSSSARRLYLKKLRRSGEH